MGFEGQRRTWPCPLWPCLLGGGWTVKSSGWEQVPFTPQGNLPAHYDHHAHHSQPPPFIVRWDWHWWAKRSFPFLSTITPLKTCWQSWMIFNLIGTKLLLDLHMNDPFKYFLLRHLVVKTLSLAFILCANYIRIISVGSMWRSRLPAAGVL